MPRNTLPAIAVKEEFSLRRLRLPRQVDTHVREFAEFYGQQTGGPMPDESAVIVGILKDYLDGNSAFQLYLKDQRRRETITTKRQAASSSTDPALTDGSGSEAAKSPAAPLPKTVASA